MNIAQVVYGSRNQLLNVKKLGFQTVNNSERIYDDTPMKVIDMVRKGDTE